MQLELKETSGPLPTSLFKLKEGNEIVGFLQLRHRPSKSNSFPEGFESHIYYEIEPAYRGKGYGNKILELGLKEAKRLGLSEVILTCLNDNVPSQKIIELNGGELLEKRVGDGGSTVLKYRIAL